MSKREVDLQRRSLPVGDTELSVVDFGQGPPTALFVHGAGGHLLQWHHQLSYFGERMRVVAFDMRGHGESQAPNHSLYRCEDFVDDLELAVEALALPERFYLVSHSFGGAVATGYAVRHPERLEGLVLMATSGEISPRLEMVALLKLPTFLLAAAQKVVKNAVSTPPPVLKKLIPNMRRWRGWELYPQISVPTLVISPEYDLLTRPEPMRRMAGLIAGSSLERIQFAGHLPQLERPARVNQILERFLIPARRTGWRGVWDSQEAALGD